MKENWFTYDPDKQTITVQLDGKKDLVIDKNNVDVSYFSGGPGGQNVNRNLNGVRLIFRIPKDYRRNARRTRELVTRSIAERSQHRNSQYAFAQLARKVRQYFYVPPRRKKTKVPKRAREKRLKNKRMRGFKKELRKSVDY